MDEFIPGQAFRADTLSVLGHRFAKTGLQVDALSVGMLAGAFVIAPFDDASRPYNSAST